MSAATDYTAAQYMAAISLALREEDMPAVVGLLHGLAVVSPADAAAILRGVELVAILRAHHDPSATTEGGAS